MHLYVLPKEITYWIPHRESDCIPSFVHTYVQYTQRDKNFQTCLAIVPLVNVATRQEALRCLPLKQMESSSVDRNTIYKLHIVNT